MDIEIVEGALDEALQVLHQLPEFDRLLADTYYFDKLKNKVSLILLAKIDGQVAGCKVGYDRYGDGSFYSWLGGVIPNFRAVGIAKRLADHQEDWAKQNGFRSIKFKTLNRHKGMLIFAIKSGFEIYNVKSRDELENYRIEMIKDLQ